MPDQPFTTAAQRVEVWVHGAPARSIEQVFRYLTGDAHDRSKVQFYDGDCFMTLTDHVQVSP